jgi:hypothetical protein
MGTTYGMIKRTSANNISLFKRWQLELLRATPGRWRRRGGGGGGGEEEEEEGEEEEGEAAATTAPIFLCKNQAIQSGCYGAFNSILRFCRHAAVFSHFRPHREPSMQFRTARLCSAQVDGIVVDPVLSEHDI